MADAPRASILSRLGRGWQAPVTLDPADFGTAFGLEMSLEPPPASADAAQLHDAPGWLERLGVKPAR